MIKRGDAIFGGSFDPPHLGHKEIVLKALEVEGVERIIIIPTFLNPFKSGFHLSPRERFELLEEMFEDFEDVLVDDFEIKQNRPVFTIETVEALKKRYNIKSIIIGADNLKSIQKWRDFEKLNSNFSWIVATRDGESLKNLKLLRDYEVITVNIPVSSTKIRAGEGFEFVDEKIRNTVKKLYKKGARLTREEIVENIIRVLDSKKGEDIEVINLEDVDYIAQEVVVASSMGGKHTSSLLDNLKRELKPMGVEFFGEDESDEWIVVDMGEVMVHLMTPAYRQRYSIEEFLSQLKNPKPN